MNTLIKRKSLFGFKYIRFKLSSLRWNEAKPKDVLLMRTLKLAELLDCTTYTAREIISRNRNLLSTNSFTLVQNARFCGQFLKLSDVVELPGLLTLNPSVLQHRFLSLEELGCSNISGTSIMRYPQLLKKSPKELKGLHFCRERQLEAMRRFVPEEDFCEQLCRMQDNGSTLWEVKEFGNAVAFAAQLGCSIATTHHMFQLFPPLRTQSTAATIRTCDVLKERFKFPASKVVRCPSVLWLHAPWLEELLQQIPTFLGLDIPTLARRLPMLLRQTTQRLRQVESVLRDLGVQPAQLLCCPKAALLCPRTLRERLEVLRARPELRPFQSHRRFLWLAYCGFGRLEARLRHLRDDHVSIAALTASEERFKQALATGEEERRCSGEALAYLAEAVGEVQLLRPCTRLRLPNCVHVVEFLRQQGVSREQLAHGLDITLYDEAVVRAHWEEMRARPEWAEWAAHYNLLQLLIYDIEVERKSSRVAETAY